MFNIRIHKVEIDYYRRTWYACLDATLDLFRQKDTAICPFTYLMDCGCSTSDSILLP